MIPVSVIVPAHDEESVIGRCLESLIGGAEPTELEIVVVCNGCHDRTAEVARRTAPEAIVCEMSAASKTAALNRGDELATRFPRIYIDADLVVEVDAIREMARILSCGEAQCAAPMAYYELGGRPWVIRRYYQIWQRLPYFLDERVGGIYGLSGEGRARFGVFPDVTNDDQFVLQQFTRGERRCLPAHRFVVEAPWRVRDVVATRARVYRGNRQLSALGTPNEPTKGAAGALLRLASRPRDLPGVVVYAGLTLAAKALGRRSGRQWERDESTRQNGSAVNVAGGRP